MSREPEAELTPDERAALAGLRDRRPVPPELEDRVVAELRRRGLVRDTPARARSRRFLALALLAAGLAGAFFLGTLVSEGPAPAGATAAAADRYLLLLYSPASQWGTPTHPATVEEYAAWARAEASEGRVLGGDELEWSGYLISGGAGSGPKPAPADDTPRALGGYFILQADSYEGALAIAADCPHVRRGGDVELRRIEDTGDGPPG